MIKIKEKKAQVWGVDLIIASVIFVIATFLTVMYFINSYSDNKSDEIFYYAESISSKILSEGYPLNWNVTNVANPGILSSDKINNTKLEYFYYLANNSYPELKSRFNTKYNFYLNFSNSLNISGNLVSGIGKIPSDYKNLIKITRFVAYSDKPITINFYIWE